MDYRDSQCPYLLSVETTAKGMGLTQTAGQADPVMLDSSWTASQVTEHCSGDASLVFLATYRLLCPRPSCSKTSTLPCPSLCAKNFKVSLSNVDISSSFQFLQREISSHLKHQSPRPRPPQPPVPHMSSPFRDIGMVRACPPPPSQPLSSYHCWWPGVSAPSPALHLRASLS